MTRKPVAVLVGVLLVLAVAAPAAAQTATVRSVIPFEFSIGKTLLPAGEYVVRFDGQFGAISLIAVDSGTRTYLPARWMSAGPGSAGQARLVFNMYGTSYFLTQVWDGSRSGPYSVSPASTEREMASLTPASSVTLIARR